MNSDNKVGAIGKDFLPLKTSFNYPRDNYLIKGSGSYYQLSEHNFVKARHQDDGAPTELRDPNSTFEWAKNKPETTYDKQAKAYFNEQDRRNYEAERNKNINRKPIPEKFIDYIVPDDPTKTNVPAIDYDILAGDLSTSLKNRIIDTYEFDDPRSSQFGSAPQSPISIRSSFSTNSSRSSFSTNSSGSSNIKTLRALSKAFQQQKTSPILTSMYDDMNQRVKDMGIINNDLSELSAEKSKPVFEYIMNSRTGIPEDQLDDIRKDLKGKTKSILPKQMINDSMTDFLNQTPRGRNQKESGPSSSPVANRTRSKKK